MKKWIPEQIKLETSLEAKTTIMKPPHFGHTTRRQGALEKTTMLGKIEGGRARGRPNMSQADSREEPQAGVCMEPTGQLRTGRGGQHSFVGTSGVRADSTAHSTGQGSWALSPQAWVLHSLAV